MVQASQRPQFVPESLTEYAAGYQKHHHRALDFRHSDARKYHAYRVETSGSSEAVIARSVTVDAAGHLHIIGEPGTVVRGKAFPGPGEMHILLPVNVAPPQ
jgi:hypothetical protein